MNPKKRGAEAAAQAKPARDTNLAPHDAPSSASAAELQTGYDEQSSAWFGENPMAEMALQMYPG